MSADYGCLRVLVWAAYLLRPRCTKLQVEPRVPSGAEEGEFSPDATLAPFRKIYNGAGCQ